MSASVNTPVYPTSLAAVTAGSAVFPASVITCMGTAGDVTVITADNQTLTVPMQPGWDIPALCISVTVSTATGLFRSW